MMLSSMLDARLLNRQVQWLDRFGARIWRMRSMSWIMLHRLVKERQILFAILMVLSSMLEARLLKQAGAVIRQVRCQDLEEEEMV